MELSEIDKIYEELGSYVVELDPDPRDRGPKHLQEQVALTRSFLNKVSHTLLRIKQRHDKVSVRLKALEAAYEISFRQTLTTDSRIRQLPNIDDRKASVAVQLRAEGQVIDDLRTQLHELELVLGAIKYRHKELTDTMSEIKAQRSLIDSEIKTGSFYGVEVPVPGPKGDPLDEAGLEAAFREMDRGFSKEPDVDPDEISELDP